MDEKNIRLRKSAQIFSLKKSISNTKMEEIFVSVSAKKEGNYLFKKTKEIINVKGSDVYWSFVSYKIHDEPPFLINTDIREVKYAFALILEIDDVLVVVKRYVDGLESLLSKYIEYFEYKQFCDLYAGKSPEYEKISTNSMSISDAVIRSRAYEGKNLNGAISAASSSRSVPRNFRMNVNGDIYSLSPKSSRINQRDVQIDIQALAEWALSVSDEIKGNKHESEFIGNFAEPISLEKITSMCEITAVFIDLESLDNNVRGSSNNKFRIFKKTTIGEVELTNQELDEFFLLMKSPLQVVDGMYSSEINGKHVKGVIGFVVNKSTISIKSALTDSFVLKNSDSDDISVTQYINKRRSVSAVFNDPKYIFFSRAAFEDKQILGNIESVISIFDDSYDFSLVKSEKEKPHKSILIDFPTNSLFYAVEKNYCLDTDKVLICDDMDDEWADHIYIQPSGTQPCISFMHAKYQKKSSYGASALHEVVAQSLKNLSRLNAGLSSYKKKYDDKWSKNYESTAINRMRCNSDWAKIEDSLSRVYSNVNSTRKVVLVTPFFKKSRLQNELLTAKKTGKFKPHQIQYIWLISTFISSCKEHGAQPQILCKK